MVLDPIPPILPVHFFRSRPQPPNCVSDKVVWVTKLWEWVMSQVWMRHITHMKGTHSACNALWRGHTQEPAPVSVCVTWLTYMHVLWRHAEHVYMHVLWRHAEHVYMHVLWTHAQHVYLPPCKVADSILVCTHVLCLCARMWYACVHACVMLCRYVERKYLRVRDWKLRLHAYDVAYVVWCSSIM